MFQVPEKYRITKIGNLSMASSAKDGNNGAFLIPFNGENFFVIASDGEGWEHVSVSIYKKKRCPYWHEMCFIKNLFWSKDETVLQYHPAENDYVNMHEWTLHLWKPINKEFPKPDKIMIGI